MNSIINVLILIRDNAKHMYGIPQVVIIDEEITSDSIYVIDNTNLN